MNNLSRLFLKQLLLYSAFLAFTGAILSFVMPDGYLTPAFPALIVFFMVLTAAILWFLLRTGEASFIRFVNAFMLTTGLKLLVLILFIVAYIFLNKGDAVPFVAAFFMLYLFYTGFEVYAVLRLSRRQKKE